ncbi:hypothetical protein PTSG_04693 [Salpingoeca rosetta]|uniref:Uncharacterized protein n=1 Tax=Salpingoeca rosetta (strain ATCC 50818 / BSB-021) TaxID=946362 RepID=F2U857_SALR5|nr:uncharacterized protein PTSG_04693 [Salpingoeca rosetta]EGD72962.1 hypothetical protein PTSG_04693 [Salpingoeca rosetta]|eukprot:XP_004994784.1 hypothetical protein PTSG_04693 [Salpingoeca rosetta]
MAQPITALDLLVLLLHHQNAHRRGAETTEVKLASTGRLTAAMVAAMFARHTRAFSMYFKSIVHMADILSQRQGAACRDLALTAGGGRGPGGAHWHGAGTGDHPKLLHPFAPMLNGTLDCLSNLHFNYIRQLFHILTTLRFDRQRTTAAGLIDDEKEDGLSQSKRIGTIAAITVTRTWLALANAADISIDGNHLSSLLQALQLIYADKWTGAPQTQETCSNVSPEDTRARDVGKDTHAVVNKKTLQAPFETKLQLPSGIAAVFVGTVRRKTDEETGLQKHAAGTQTSSRS